MMQRTIEIAGRPVPQPRTRSKANGQHYTPDNGVAAYKHHIGVMARMAGCKPIRGPVEMHFTFVFSRPPSHFTKGGVLRKGAMDYPGHQCGDADNLQKAVKDALTGIAYGDDTQVVAGSFVKKWGPESRTVVRIGPWQNDE